jgi:hypothetical protein
MKQPFLSGFDHAKAKYGAAHIFYPTEYEQIVKEVADAGGKISWRLGQYGFSPAKNKPGLIILDTDASISAMRHELQHFRDDLRNGMPGLSYYFQRPSLFWQMEFRAYMVELKFAREKRDFDLARKIIEDMKQRRRELLGQ